MILTKNCKKKKVIPMNKKGQGAAEALMLVPFLLIIFFIVLQIFVVITTGDGLLYDLLDDNIALYGASTKLMVQLIPLILGALILLVIFREVSRPRPQY